MAGRQHETRPDRETVRKGQISDEYGKRETLRTTENIKCSSQNSYSGNLPDDLNIDKTRNVKVHLYSLSIMNEASKVLILFFMFRSYL